MDPRNRSPHQTMRALREAGITPKVHPEGDRLVLPKGQRALLTEELRAALKANHADLLRGEFFREEIRALVKRLEERGLGDHHPARDAACRALGEDGTEERLNDAWAGGRLDHFKATLAAWASPAYRALEAASLPEDATDSGGDRDVPADDEPALFGAEPPRSMGAA
ncbi:MAG: hypothetical protein M3R38_33270 [Actinomycetota bacterium]|nr:hypothetical protein [Actinomycetota bacterium]